MDSVSQRRSGVKLELFCIFMALTLWGYALGNSILRSTVVIGSISLSAGSLFGLTLAMVTRTKPPTLIYFWLSLSLLTLWPIWVGWPAEGETTSRQFMICEIIRYTLFIFAIPGPFAFFGQHGPDVIFNESHDNGEE